MLLLLWFLSSVSLVTHLSKNGPLWRIKAEKEDSDDGGGNGRRERRYVFIFWDEQEESARN